MSSVDDDPRVKEVAHLFATQNPHIKLTLHPNQLLIGNYSPRLIKDAPLVLEQNTSQRLCLRFKIDSNPRVGYPANDIGVALGQIESISVKDEYGDNLPALVITFKSNCIRKIWSMMPGMQAECEKSYVGENRAFARNLTFILGPIPSNSDGFCTVKFQKELKSVEYFFDFDVAKYLLLNTVKDVWHAIRCDQAKTFSRAHVNRTSEGMKEMSNNEWAEHLTAQKLMKSVCGSKETVYIRSEENPDGRRKPQKAKDDRGGFAPKHPSTIREERSTIESLKRAAKSYTQRREGPEPTVFGKEIKLREFSFEPITRKRKMRNGDGKKKKASESTCDPQHAFDYTAIHSLPLPYFTNVFPPYVNDCPSSVDYVSERMSHLGEDSEDVEMKSTSQIPGLGDFHLYNGYSYQYVNATVPANDQYWLAPGAPQTVAAFATVAAPPEAVVPEQEAADEDFMNHFFITGAAPLEPTPSKTPRIQGAQDVLSAQKAMARGKTVVVQTAPKTARKPTVSTPRTPAGPERIPADSPLFTFPPAALSVSSPIDPVVLLVKDVKTLDRKEFVNDNVMSFMLNYISVYMIDKQLMSKICMNNTFWYSNLTRNLPMLCFSQRRPIDPVNQAQLVSNCSRVFRWTRRFDVFKKDYIVIPINEDYHWLLVTVFNPAGAIVDVDSEETSRAKPKCYVAFFDPLSGLDPVKRNHMCHIVATYLHELYKHTKEPGRPYAEPHETLFDPERVIVTRPLNTPVQDNFFDCGLFALYFIEGLFCYLNRPVTVHDFPNFDWSKRYPKANEMADLMRDKIYNLVHKVADKPARSRLARFEKQHRHGLSQEGSLRKTRRHSACDRLTPRHKAYLPRRYSVNPPNRNVLDDPMFMSPRDMVEFPCTQKVRSLRWPEESFPVIY